MLKYKIPILVVLAVVFVVVLFFIQNKSTYTNQNLAVGGLTYNSNDMVGDFVNKDTDGDGIPDWQENLFGTDPTKKETTPGIPDEVAVEKLKAQTGTTGQASIEGQENLTQTDKFSRELFSTMASLDQTGAVDQDTIEKLSDSLNNQIQNSTPRKIYVSSDLKITQDNSPQAIKKYNDTLDSIYTKYPIKGDALDILGRFTGDGDNVNVSVLAELDPIVSQINKIETAMAKMDVPQSLSSLHLNVLNGIERVVENLSDIRLYDTDPVVSLSGITQYQKNSDALEAAANSLANTISQRLNN